MAYEQRAEGAGALLAEVMAAYVYVEEGFQNRGAGAQLRGQEGKQGAKGLSRQALRGPGLA